VIPTPLSVLVFAAAAVAALIAGGDASWWPWLVAFDAAVILMLVVDTRVLVRRDVLEAHRRAERVLSLGEANRVVLVVRNTTGRRLVVQIVEPLVHGLEPSTVPLGRRAIPAGETLELEYEITPRSRGLYTIPPTSIRVRGPLGLGWRQLQVGEPREIRVYPNVMAVGRYQHLIRRSRLRQMGISSVRQRGHGTEFESLRDYIPGDDPAWVDWKATARRAKLISRNYQAERSQTIMLCLDAGRMMTTHIGGMSRFDHAVNSALLLAHVALGHGDGVGLVVFSGGIERWVPPRKGRGHLSTIVEALYDVEPDLVEPNYRQAVMRAAIGRRRSLVVMFTDVSGEESASELVPYVRRLVPRHLPLVVFLKDREVEARADGLAGDEARPDAWAMAAAANFLEEKEKVMEYLRGRGTVVLDVHPGALAPRVVNSYLEIKARSLI